MEMVGSTKGNQDVPIRARVEGFLESMEFTEGQFVSEDQLLYTIDPQPFQAKVVEAVGYTSDAPLGMKGVPTVEGGTLRAALQKLT